MTDSIRVIGLVKRYGPRTVVDGVTFSVGPGEIVGLLGPNGAGKTTTVEVVEGYRRPDAGEVAVLGGDPAAGGREHRARVGVMLQGGGFDPRATVREILALYAAFHIHPRPVDGVIELLELGSVAGARYRTLSTGERQRLALGVAVVGRPDVLVLDEPTAGMDPAARARARELIGDLRAEGAAILLTSHELTDVERLADRLVVIDRGRVVAAGSPHAIGRSGPARLRFRLARPLTPDETAGLGRVLEGAITAEHGWYAAAALGAAPSPELLRRLSTWLADHEILAAEIRTDRGTLEDRYLDLVSESEAT